MKPQKIIILLLLCCILSGCGKQSEQVTIETEFTSVVTTESELFTEIPTESTTFITGIAESTVGTFLTNRAITEITNTSQTSQQTSMIHTDTATVNTSANQTINIHNYTVKNSTGSNSKSTKSTTSSTTTFTETVNVTTPTDSMIETTNPTEESTEPTTEVIFKSGTVQEIMDMMTLEEKIYQLFIVTPETLLNSGTVTVADEQTQNALISQPVCGLIYFADNLIDSNQTTMMLSNSQQYARQSGIGLFLAIDEEGGLVARCAKKLGSTALSPMATYGERNDFNEAVSIGQTLGMGISQFGFNLDFAPVADVNLNSGNELGNRIFSDNPEVTGNMVSGVVQGLQSTGVAATLKHFPGLGAENGNAHYDDAVYIDRTLEQLRTEEFVPFQSGINAGADFVMVSHQIVTSIGDNLPSCLSYTVCTDLLRNELNFDGIIITDSFAMNTISGRYSPADSAVLAIQAGVDIILIPTDLTASVQALENAVYSGQISEARINQSVEKILLEKQKLNLLG
ncbi:MAG: glycoside hydrolase family 3 [Oscillospiraceae bacterium]|nr:glycoside hydrolase family 3 [Oscillospiraceae bacterium]